MGGGAGTPNDGRRRASNAKGAPRRKTGIHISLRPAKQLPVQRAGPPPNLKAESYAGKTGKEGISKLLLTTPVARPGSWFL